MFLEKFLEVYVCEHDFIRDITVQTFYRPAIGDFERYLNRAARLSDLNDATINKWLTSKIECGKQSMGTIDAHRRAVLALWRAAWRNDLIDAPPRKVRRTKRNRIIVQAWTREEVESLINFFRQIPRKLMSKTQLREREFFLSLALTGYETGMRLGDLLSLERSWIRTDADGEGFVTIVQSKSGVTKTSRISKSTMEIIDQLMAQQPNRRLIWPLPCERRSFYRRFKTLVHRSGIRVGTFRWLRRSGTTHVEQQKPGCGFRHAGHADARVTMAHYIDRSQLDADVIAPAKLFEPEVDALDEVHRMWVTLSNNQRQQVVSFIRDLVGPSPSPSRNAG